MPDEAPAAAESADLTRPGIIEASAGTGKTFTIGQIYLALLRGEKTYSRSDGNASRTPGVPVGADGRRAALRVREILVVTFTEAATAELRARLRGNIRAALADVPAEDAAVRDALRLADAEFDEAAVFTIHGFCSRVLKEFGLAPLKKEIVPDAGEELRRFAARWRAAKIAAGDEAFFGVSADDAAKVVALFLKNPKLVPIPPRDAKDARGNALFRVAKEAVPEWLALRKNARDLSYDEMLSTLLDAQERDAELAAKIAAGAHVALVCDAGTPTLSDPGFRVVRECRRAGLAVESVPGPCALIAALSVSGLPTNAFAFHGFLPPKSAARRRFLEENRAAKMTLAVYESCHRIRAFAEEIAETLGEKRVVCFARELTKLHETVLTGTIGEVLPRLSGKNLKGEFVVLIAPESFVL